MLPNVHYETVTFLSTHVHLACNHKYTQNDTRNKGLPLFPTIVLYVSAQTYIFDVKVEESEKLRVN